MHVRYVTLSFRLIYLEECTQTAELPIHIRSKPQTQQTGKADESLRLRFVLPERFCPIPVLVQRRLETLRKHVKRSHSRQNDDVEVLDSRLIEQRLEALCSGRDGSGVQIKRKEVSRFDDS